VERAERLLRRLKAADARGITQTELDSAETGLASDRAALGSAKSAVSQAEAKLASTAFNMKHTRIFAPIGGRIGKSLMHAGDFVSPSKGALARIVQMDPVRVTFPITDRAYLAWGGASVGDKRRLRLRLADGSIYPATGKWAFSDNEMSAETATLLVRAHFPNSKRLLVPNAYVTVLADEADPAPVPVIPVSALMQTAQATGVWVMDGEDTVRFRAAKPGARADGKIRLLTGVKPGEKIVVQGIHKLGDGMRVRVVPASEFH
jgi:membrane fusion protein (multidrug efflux system)